MSEQTQTPGWAPGTIQPNGALPLWRQVLRVIERDIRAGRLMPGQQLPTEAELAQALGVHRHTVRRAVETLSDQGLLRVEQGRGTFVKEATLRHRLGLRTAMSTTARSFGRDATREVVGSRRTKADQAQARELRVATGALLQRVDTVSFVDGTPISVSAIYYPLPRFNTIERLIETTASIREALRLLGVDEFEHLETRVTASMPSAAVARLLNQPKSRPVLSVTNVNIDKFGVPIQLSYASHAANWVEFIFNYRLDQEPR